jgi:hypothetical protein
MNYSIDGPEKSGSVPAIKKVDLRVEERVHVSNLDIERTARCEERVFTWCYGRGGLHETTAGFSVFRYSKLYLQA